jgi:hypothetical protein
MLAGGYERKRRRFVSNKKTVVFGKNALFKVIIGNQLVQNVGLITPTG